MRALVHNPDAPQGLQLGDVPEPDPRPSEALIRVAAVSLNFADVAFLRDRQTPGAVPGFDASGVVLDVVELEVAAAIPVAGVTALRALRRLGSLVGRRVLITGASGGVGRFAVQLAARAGAHVVASVGSPERGEGLSTLGAAEVVVGVAPISQLVYGALDNVGGRTLADVYALLEPGGSVQSVGMASLEPTTIDFEQARLRGGDTRIEAFAIGPGFGPDLAFLVGLVTAGELDVQIDWRGPWEKAADAAAALLGRKVRGKAILEVSR